MSDLSANSDLIPQKEVVEGTCPECGAEELRRYPVLAAGGWFQVVKCQRCLYSLERVPWNRLGWVTLAEDNAV
jgi:vanillate/4-hydroxybenzoate decarboxylase subunit D